MGNFFSGTLAWMQRTPALHLQLNLWHLFYWNRFWCKYRGRGIGL